MASEAKSQETPVSDEAVKAKTGKVWAEWFEVLDGAGAAGMSHKEIATYLNEQQGIPGWWAQNVTVGYERARGRREKHQTPGGYEASVSRVVAVPRSQLYQAWVDEGQRGQWLGGQSYTVRGSTENKSVRLAWGEDGGSSVRAEFYDKGVGKSQVTIQHTKLADSEEVAAMKQYWQEALDRLKQVIGG